MVGARFFRIANLEHVWVEASVFENDLPTSQWTSPSTSRFRSCRSRVRWDRSYVYPYLDEETRTGLVRSYWTSGPRAAARDVSDVDFTVDWATACKCRNRP